MFISSPPLAPGNKRIGKALLITHICRAMGIRVHRKKPRPRDSSNEAGFSLMELLVALVILSIAFGTAVSNMKTMNRPLHNGAYGMMGFFKQARAKAISSTNSYFITPASATRLITSYGKNCEVSSPTLDHSLFYDLPKGASLQDSTWSVCFSSRGLASTSQDFVLKDNDSKTKMMQVFLGGAVRVQ